MGGVADTLFSGGQQAAASDMEKAIKRAQQQATGYYQPYYQAGKQALPQYQSAIAQMQDPQAYYNQMMGGYQMSPAAQFNMQQGIQAGTNAASAGGMNLSGAQRDALARYAQGITSQDQQQYLGNLMGINQGYLGGLGNLMGQGFNAGSNMAGLTANLGLQQGQAQAQGDLSRASMWNNLLSGGGSLGLKGMMSGFGQGQPGGFSFQNPFNWNNAFQGAMGYGGGGGGAAGGFSGLSNITGAGGMMGGAGASGGFGSLMQPSIMAALL